MALQKHVKVLLAYIALTVVMTYPAVTRLRAEVVGDGGDPWQTMWRFEHTADLLQEAWWGGTFITFLQTEFFGEGEPRLVNLSVWPWMPLHWLFGQPTGYNLVWLASFVLSGYAMFLLVSYLTRIMFKAPIEQPAGERQKSKLGIANNGLLQQAAAFIAGAYYMFLPFHVAHAQGHFGAMQLQWLPLIVLLTMSSLQQPSIWKIIGLAALVIVQLWSEHHYLLWLVLSGFVFMICYRQDILRYLISNRGKVFTILLLVLLLLVGGMSYLPTLRLAFAADSILDLGREQLVRFSADLFSFFTPSPFHPVWGTATHSLFSGRFTGNINEAIQYLGVLPLLVVIFFHQRIPRTTKRFWTATAFLFFIVSLGPQLHVLGSVTTLHLPYDLVDEWPGLNAVRAVARAGAMIGLAVAVLLGLTLATQLRRPMMALAALILVLVEFLFFPVTTQSAHLNPVYEHLRTLPGGTVIEIPAATNYTAASRALYASRAHQKKVIGSIALERGQSQDEFLLSRSVPVVRQLLYLRTTELREGRAEFFDQGLVETLPDVLHWLGVDALLIHTDSVSRLQLAALQGFLEQSVGLTPRYFGDTVLYDVSSISQTPRGTDGVFVMRDGGWANVGYDPTRDSVFAEVPDRASITLVNVNQEPVTVALSFTVPAESRGPGLVLYHNQVLAEYAQGAASISFDVALPPGASVIIFDTTGQDKAIVQNPKLRVLGSQ